MQSDPTVGVPCVTGRSQAMSRSPILEILSTTLTSSLTLLKSRRRIVRPIPRTIFGWV